MAEEVTKVGGKNGLLVVLLLLVFLAGIAIGVFLFDSVFHKPKEKTMEEEMLAAPTSTQPQRVPQTTPESQFLQTYKELDREFIANITNSRKVIQVQIGLMTTYDDRVIKNVDKHGLALRSAILDRLRQITEKELDTADFRKELAEKIRLDVNAVLEKYEGFGGIEELYFTAFVIQ